MPNTRASVHGFIVRVPVSSAEVLNRENLLMCCDCWVQGGVVDGGLALARVAQLGGSDEMLQLLLQLGAKPDATDEFGRTALMLAVSRSDKSMTASLLAAGANCEGIGGET